MKMLLKLKVWMVKESFFYCHRYIEDKQCDEDSDDDDDDDNLLHEVLKGNQNVGAQTQDHQSAQLSS